MARNLTISACSSLVTRHSSLPLRLLLAFLFLLALLFLLAFLLLFFAGFFLGAFPFRLALANDLRLSRSRLRGDLRGLLLFRLQGHHMSHHAVQVGENFYLGSYGQFRHAQIMAEG